jgi:hypothetical protein
MTRRSRRANLTSPRALCAGALLFIATPAAAQSGDVDLFPPAPTGPAAAPVASPTEPVAPPQPALPEPPAPSPAPPPTAPNAPARWQLAGGLSGSIFTIHYGVAASQFADPTGNRGRISLGPTVFLSPVRDDDAPRSLQPYLQRTSSVSAGISGGGFVTRYGNNGTFTRTDSDIGGSASVDAYVSRDFALTGGFGYRYDVLHEDLTLNKGHSFSGNAGFAVRIGDARLDASYSFNAYDVDGSFARLRWGSVGLGAFIVLARSFTLGLAGHAADDGGGGGVDLGYYPTKNLGLFLGFSGSTFAYAATDVHTSFYTGSASLSYWVTPGMRLSWGYSLDVITEPAQQLALVGYDEIQHTASVSVLARLP